MSKLLSLAAAGVAITCFASTTTLKQTANTMFRQIERAFKKKDANAFDTILRANITSDFKYTEADKVEDYDTMVAGVKQSFAMIKQMKSSRVKILSVDEHGDAATMTISHNLSGTTMGQDKKLHKFEMGGVSKNDWRREGGVWKMSTFTWISEKMTMDGKPFDPSATGASR